MGLCPVHKKITTLFCFKHRKNVCELCLNELHGNCVVKSYLEWLSDSEAFDGCGICKKPFDASNTVRLACLDVFHLSCLDDLYNQPGSQLKCVNCQSNALPPANAGNQIALKLRADLKLDPQAKWAATFLATETPQAVVYEQPALPQEQVRRVPPVQQDQNYQQILKDADDSSTKYKRRQNPLLTGQTTISKFSRSLMGLLTGRRRRTLLILVFIVFVGIVFMSRQSPSMPKVSKIQEVIDYDEILDEKV